MRERTARLPVGVVAACPSLLSLTPSLTGLVVGFLLDEESANLLDRPFRATFSTRVEPTFTFTDVIRYVVMDRPMVLGNRIYSPDIIRRGSLQSCVSELEQRCVRWVSQNLPGAFAERGESAFPTAVLFITEEAKPLTPEAARVRAFHGTGIDLDFDAWESQEWPGARVILPHVRNDGDSRLVFACRRCDAVPDKPYYPDRETNWTIGQFADDQVRGLLSRWSLSCLLNGYHERLATLRDRAARSRTPRPVHSLKELRSLARTAFYDSTSCAQEIEKLTESDRAYRHDVLEMESVRALAGEARGMLPMLQEWQKRRAQQVLSEVGLVRSTLSLVNELAERISNTRIQRFLALLTTFSVAAALWAVFLALKG